MTPGRPASTTADAATGDEPDRRAGPSDLHAVLPESLHGAIGRPSRIRVWPYDVAGYLLAGLAWLRAALRRLLGRRGTPWPRIVAGPDGTRVVFHGLPLAGRAGTTYGNVIHLAGEPSGPEGRVLLNHEYVHVLQARHAGILFLVGYLLESWRALRRGAHYYLGNAYERQAYRLADRLAHRPDLPDLWQVGAAHDLDGAM